MVPEFIILMAKEGLNGGISKKQTLLAAKIMINNNNNNNNYSS